MKSRDFCYWLQGIFEVAKPEQLNAEATEIIRKHLAMVFIHEIDPSFPADQKIDLDNAHTGNVIKGQLKPYPIPNSTSDINFRC